MRAAILANGKLSIKDVPKPSPGYEEALVKITTAGVCHSDLHMIKGDWGNVLPPVPIPMGSRGNRNSGGIRNRRGEICKKRRSGDSGMGGMGGGYWVRNRRILPERKTSPLQPGKKYFGYLCSEFISVW